MYHNKNCGDFVKVKVLKLRMFGGETYNVQLFIEFGHSGSGKAHFNLKVYLLFECVLQP